MSQFNFNTPVVRSNGTQDDKQTLGQVLSELIGTTTEGKTLKLYGWHKTLQIGENLILDDSDRRDLIALLEADKRIFIYIKGQLLEILEEKEGNV